MSDRAKRNEKISEFMESLEVINPFVKKEPKSEQIQEVVIKGMKAKIIDRTPGAANDK